MKDKYSSKQIEAIYDKHAKWYDFRMYFTESIIKKLRRKLIGNANGRVLEISFGSGVNLPYYCKDCEIVGIDISKEMLKRAKKRASKYGRKVNLKEGNVEKLIFKDEQFDYVVDTLGLCTFANPDKALIEMKRVCKRNGKILLLEHGLGRSKIINKFLNWKEARHYKKSGCHLTRDIIGMVKKSGLSIVEEKRKCFGTICYIIAKK